MNVRRSKIFFSGIAGSGVSAIAAFMADKGHAIAGSDRAFDLNPDHPLKKIFLSKGIAIFPQNGSGLDNTFDYAVFSTAVEPDNPEMMKAGTLSIPIKTRPDFLAELTADYATIAVAGTSGKSTTAGLLAFLMHRLGLRPNFLGGGRVKEFRTPSNPGNSLTGDSDHLIIEACESDGSIVNYSPQISIILNLALDHHSVDVTSEMFRSLIRNTKEKVFINADDDNLKDLTGPASVTFSLNGPSAFKAEDIAYKPFGTEFSLTGVRFSLSIPGRHNLYNAAACIAYLSESGIPLEEVAAILPEFSGIDRRFDVHLNDGTNLVIDDYAHNPHKIASLMTTMKNIRTGICYIFQPHGFGPTMLMKKEYIETFVRNLRESDRLILLPIYYVGGTARKDISSHDLADGIKAAGKAVEVATTRDEILTEVCDFRTCVVFGARDESLSDFAKAIAEKVRQCERRETVNNRTQ